MIVQWNLITNKSSDTTESEADFDSSLFVVIALFNKNPLYHAEVERLGKYDHSCVYVFVCVCVCVCV